MAEQFTLEAQPRTVLGKQVKALRRENLVPAVVYGVGGEPISITCQYRPLEIVLTKAGGTHLVNVVVEGQTHNAIVREVQRDKVKRTILHVDFMRVDLTKKLRTTIQVMFVGEAKLPSDLHMTHNIQSIEVESLPTEIPEHIEVNVSKLRALGDQITVGDLPAIEHVTYLSDAHEIIARIDTLNVATADDEAPEVSAAEPEVIEKGKKEEEDF
jgi:large subunit ribosomal protein L25